MTRGQQTAWIVGTLLFLGLVTLTVHMQQPDPNDPYDECKDFFGVENKECSAAIASRRLRALGGY